MWIKLNVCKIEVGGVGEWIKSGWFIVMVSCSKNSGFYQVAPNLRVFGMTNIKQFWGYEIFGGKILKLSFLWKFFYFLLKIFRVHLKTINLPKNTTKIFPLTNVTAHHTKYLVKVDRKKTDTGSEKEKSSLAAFYVYPYPNIHTDKDSISIMRMRGKQKKNEK